MPLLCPACHTDLVMAERQGVEIDYCPKCRGVLLDRGELDKIVERGASAPQTAPSGSAPMHGRLRSRDDDDDDDDDRRRQGGPPSRRRSWLSDIFD